MINALIIDDEEKAVAVLRRMIATHCPDIKIVGEADDVEKATKAIEKLKPQLVFLDIEMPGESGFSLLEKVKQRNFHVIFVTAHSEFAVKAFRFSVTDYLLKPVGIDELIQAVGKVKAIMDFSIKNPAASKDFSSVANQTLRIPSTEGTVFVYLHNIIRMEADGAYTHIFLEDNRHYISSYNLKQFEEHLDADIFMRVHRSHLINLKNIKSVTRKGGLFVEMTDGSVIEVAKRNKDAFLNAYR